MSAPTLRRFAQWVVQHKWLALASTSAAMLILTVVASLRLSPVHVEQAAPTPQPAAPPPFSVIFSDSFDTPQIDLTKWQLGPGDQFTPVRGSLVANYWLRENHFDQPALYSRNAFAAQAGRALAATMRVQVLSSSGPYALFAPLPYQDDPLATSIGTGVHRFWNDPFSHQWVRHESTGGRFLRATAIVNGTLIPYWNAVIEGIDHLAITSLRQKGSYHLVTGGDFGEFPTATLIWVNDQDYAKEYYAGIETRRTQPNILDVKVIDLDARFSSQYGLAHAADTFQRPDGSALTATEVGNLQWESTNLRIHRNRLEREDRQADASAFLKQAIAEGLFEVSFHSPPASAAEIKWYFRRVDSDNWWRVRCSDESLALEKMERGVAVTVAAAPSSEMTCQAGHDHRLVVRAHGPNITVWLNNSQLTPENGVNDPFLHDTVMVGLEFEAGRDAPAVSAIALWPKQVVLPQQAGPAPAAPAPGLQADVVFQDHFNAADGTRLKDHTPDRGGPWTENVGGWVIQQGAAVPPLMAPAYAYATVDAGLLDHATSVVVNLSGGERMVNFPNYGGWEVGAIIRFLDARNYVWARFLWQGGSPEIEVWEIRKGNGQFLNAKNIRGLVSLDKQHTMTAAIVGKKIAVYLDGKLIVATETSLLAGTRVGMVMDEEPIEISAIESFTVTSVRPDTIAPPAVSDPTYAVSGPEILLDWTPPHDDASGVAFYRVYRSDDGSLGQQVTRDGEVVVPPFVDRSNPPTGRHFYTVRAVDGYGNENTTELNRQVAVDYTQGTPASLPPALPDPVNVVENASFEMEDNGFPANWDRQKGAGRDESLPHAGGASLDIQGSGPGDTMTFIWQMPPVTASSEYRLSAWIRTENVTGSGVSLRYAVTEPSVQLFQTAAVSGTADWTNVSVTFATPPNFQAGRLDILWSVAEGGRAWVDDVRLERLTYENLVKNPSFETVEAGVPANWPLPSASALDADTTRSGGLSLRLAGSTATASIHQPVMLKADTVYQIAYWIKFDRASTPGITVKYTAADTADVPLFDSGGSYGTTSWRRVERLFRTPPNYGSGQLEISWGLRPDEAAWIDDVSLCERRCS